MDTKNNTILTLDDVKPLFSCENWVISRPGNFQECTFKIVVICGFHRVTFQVTIPLKANLVIPLQTTQFVWYQKEFGYTPGLFESWGTSFAYLWRKFSCLDGTSPDMFYCFRKGEKDYNTDKTEKLLSIHHWTYLARRIRLRHGIRVFFF